ncbi:MAG: pyrroline-5-carboxylate reductase [Pseudomonadota bacterium]
MIDRLLLVGCGKMGSALLNGWLSSGMVEHVDVVEPNPDHIPDDYRVRHVPDIAGLADLPDVVVLAVKPQYMDEAIVQYRRFVRPECVFLSIAAGKTLGYFQKSLGEHAAIVRVMPNTPAAIGKGISVLVADKDATRTQREVCQHLMEAVGLTEWVEEEGLIDVVTALSGGGPAYVFLLIETLAEAGAKAGLSAEMAMHLARQTIIGSGALIDASDEEPAELRRNVTSPQGTTEAALKVLMADKGIQPIFDRAIAAATDRARELDS